MKHDVKVTHLLRWSLWLRINVLHCIVFCPSTVPYSLDHMRRISRESQKNTYSSKYDPLEIRRDTRVISGSEILSKSLFEFFSNPSEYVRQQMRTSAYHKAVYFESSLVAAPVMAKVRS